MTKNQNTDENLQDEKKVIRRGRPKKVQDKAIAQEETIVAVKTRKPRTSTTVANEIKPLENSKSKKKAPVTAIQDEESSAPKTIVPIQDEKKTSKRNPRKTNVTNSKTEQAQPEKLDNVKNPVQINEEAKDQVKVQDIEQIKQDAPKKRGRKPKALVNLAQDLELPQEVRDIEQALAMPRNKRPMRSNNKVNRDTNSRPHSAPALAPEGMQSFNAYFSTHEQNTVENKTNSNTVQDTNLHDSIQLLPSQRNNKVHNEETNRNQEHQKNIHHDTLDQDYTYTKDMPRPNKGLSKNFFKRIPLDDNAIKQKETMYNPMLYPAPKQLQGKVQTKKQNPQQMPPFAPEQNAFYPQALSQFPIQENQQNQYVNWQNQKQKNQNRNNNQNLNRQKNQNNRQRQQSIKNMPQPAPAFDNSSIIAAITGKSFETDDIYSPLAHNTNAPHFPQAPNQQNNYAKNQQNIRQGKGQRKNNAQAFNAEHIASDETSILHQNMLYQRSQNAETTKKNPKNFSQAHLTKLPSFAQSALEHKDDLSFISSPLPETPYYAFDDDAAMLALETKAVTSEKKTRGRKKKADLIEEQIPNDLKMFVSVQSEEQVEVALVKDDTVVEYFVEMSHQAKIRGNIYKASIHNVDPNLQAAFINFGSVKNGFLQIDEVHPDYYLAPHAPTKNHKFPLISKVLRPGQELFVQIVKEPTLTKGAFLTTWISLAGRFLVLTPGQEQLGVSRKVSDPDERARLRAMLDGVNPEKGMGIIIRTAAANATQEELQADLDYLQKLWLDILEKSSEKSAPALVHQEVELTQRVVRDYLNEDVGEIWTNDKEMAHSITKMAELLYPQKANIVRHFNNQRAGLWDRFGLQKQIDEISQREVALPSGGRVVFDQTEALMAIDINSGKTQNKSNFQDMVLQTNIEAAQAIARHLRLRDIGGQVVIDFIEVHDKNAVKEIEKAFKKAMQSDRARYEIGHISPFGLLEVIRQRIGSSAISISTEPCPHCNGTGTRRNMEWQAQDALKEIAKKARQEKTIKYVYNTNTELALYLLNMKRDRISELEERFNIRIEIQAK